MSTKPKILIAETEDFTPEVAVILNEIADVTFSQLDKAKLKEALQEYDIFWFRLGFKIDEKVLNGNLRCKIIVNPVTGIDHIDEELCREKGIEIISLRGEVDFLNEIRATAELTIGLTISLLRGMIPAYQSVLKGEWKRDNFRGNEIYKKNVGILGVGRLGRINAGYFKALGANVRGYDIRDDFPGDIERASSIEELLKFSDIVSIHVRYGNDTDGLIGRGEFKHFKKGAVLINTSRGGIIDEDALLDALKTGLLKGAALDVLRNEQEISENNPLIKFARNNNNLIILPHIGGNTYESFEKTEKFLADKLILRIKEIYN